MSFRTIKAFETFRASATLPPPPDTATLFRKHADRLREQAQKMLADANALDESADAVEGWNGVRKP
jgi:hypothetical protein